MVTALGALGPLGGSQQESPKLVFVNFKEERTLHVSRVILAMFFTNTSSSKRETAALFHCITFGMYKIQKVCMYSNVTIKKKQSFATTEMQAVLFRVAEMQSFADVTKDNLSFKGKALQRII